MAGPRILILSKEFVNYRNRLLSQGLVEPSSLVATLNPKDELITNSFQVVFGEPSLIKQVLPRLSDVKWVHSTWAGVEPLLAAELPRNYLLTNSRGMFGPLMSEFVFAYMLMRERKLMEKMRAQAEKRWD